MEGKAVLSKFDQNDPEIWRDGKFVLGYLNGEDERGDVDFRLLIATQDEMIHLLKFWITKALKERLWLQVQYSNAWASRENFANRRWGLIESLLPKDAASKAVEDAFSDFKTVHKFTDEIWEDFRNGGELFREKFFEEARASRESEALLRDDRKP
jgi:hypothetical protein